MAERPPLLVCLLVAAFMAMLKIYARHILRPLKPFQTLFPWFPIPAEASGAQERSVQAMRAALEKEWAENPQPQTRLFTDEDLCVSYEPIYLAIRGEVFNVTKGTGFYGHDGGYQHLARMDNSMGFTDLSLCASHSSNWTHTDVEAIESWRTQYHKDYTYVGRHVGDYYDELGSEKPLMRAYKAKIKEGKYINEVQKRHRQKYPGCNSSSSQKESKVWCAFKNKGHPLKDGSPDWVGWPRRILRPHSTHWECACIKDLENHDIDADKIRLYKIVNGTGDRPAEYCDTRETKCYWNPREVTQDE